ncbi:MAG: DUF1345 domain-containing protein [Rhizomicrobium sp.]|nr:DUF1345 domain-containing protein [Rhizomicrobium sp.]
MRLNRAHLYHHGRFYAAALIGVAVYGGFMLLGWPQPVAAAGDAFFIAYLAAVSHILLRHTTEDLKRRAALEDEGIVIVVAIALAIIALNVASVFLALHSRTPLDVVSLVLLLAAAPLGWCVLHMISAFHYADLHYFDPPGPGEPGTALLFPGTEEPDLWDFIYFSFVIGMTAQVSDVQVAARDMRRAVTAHSIVSFFFNTVLIALVVNAVAVSH